ncbi:MAG: DNA repair protein RecO [Patescibacteria group bacterium]|mgnify:CR=1 FL=1
MKLHSYKSQGIVLARRNFGEADRILILYTKDFGRVSLIAKGVRKLTSRKRGHVEVFSQITFSAVKTHGIDIMTEADTIDSFEEVRVDLGKVALAFYFCEAIGKTTHEGEENRELYERIIYYFKELKNEKKLKTLRNDFIHDLVVILGFLPRGKKIDDIFDFFEDVTERKLSSERIGKKMLE